MQRKKLAKYKQLSLLKSTPTLSESSNIIGQKSLSGLISHLFTPNQDSSISSQAASPAPIPVVQAIAPESMENIAVSGLKCSELSKKTKKQLFVLKTQPDCSIEEWEKYFKGFTKAGTMRNGRLSAHTPLERPIDEIDCLLLPTPTAGVKKLGSRSPGQTKLELWFRSNGLLADSQCLSGETIALLMGFPPNWVQCLSECPEVHQDALDPDTSMGDPLSPPVPRSPLPEPSIYLISSAVDCDLGGDLVIPLDRKTESRGSHFKAIATSSKTDCHNTPKQIIEATLECFNGAIALDPCSNSYEFPNVPAALLFTIEDDGLSQPWLAKSVYCNPPYSDTAAWATKLIEHVRLGDVQEAIALVKSDNRVAWYTALMDACSGFCLYRGYLKFGEAASSAPFASIVFYFGDCFDNFDRAFNALGWVFPARSRGEIITPRSRSPIENLIDERQDLIDLGVQPWNAWLETAKVHDREFKQLFWRSTQPIFEGKKRRYIGLEDSQAAVDARAIALRKARVKIIDKLFKENHVRL